MGPLRAGPAQLERMLAASAAAAAARGPTGCREVDRDLRQLAVRRDFKISASAGPGLSVCGTAAGSGSGILLPFAHCRPPPGSNAAPPGRGRGPPGQGERSELRLQLGGLPRDSDGHGARRDGHVTATVTVNAAAAGRVSDSEARPHLEPCAI